MMKNILRKSLAVFFSISLLFVIATNALAQTTVTTGEPVDVNPTLENPFKGAGNSLPDLFKAIVDNILIPIGSVIAVIAFIWSGFLFVMAQGDPGKLKTAKASLLYTAIGTAILLGAWVITSVITGTIDSFKDAV